MRCPSTGTLSADEALRVSQGFIEACQGFIAGTGTWEWLVLSPVFLTFVGIDDGWYLISAVGVFAAAALAMLPLVAVAVLKLS